MTRVKTVSRLGFAGLMGSALLLSAASPAAATEAAVSVEDEASVLDLVEPGDPGAVVAHRGDSSRAPENTMPSVILGAEGGADYVEIDIDYTADGEIVAIHDDDVDRTTDGTGDIRDLSYDYVSGLDAGSWFHPNYAGTPMPRLQDVLAYLSQTDAQLLLEYKADWSPDMVAASADIIEAYGMEDQMIAQSFNMTTMENLQAELPDVDRMVLGNIEEDSIETAQQLGAVGYNPNYNDVLEDPEWVEEANDAGLAVFVWTSNEAAEWAELTEYGVEGIVTDHPGPYANWIDHYEATQSESAASSTVEYPPQG